MSTKVSTLGESLFAHIALIRSLPGVFSEMIAEVATFFEHAITSPELALEVHFHSQGLLILDLNSFVPVIWDARKRLLYAVVTLVNNLIVRVLDVLLYLNLNLSFTDFFVSSFFVLVLFSFYLGLQIHLWFCIRM